MFEVVVLWLNFAPIAVIVTDKIRLYTLGEAQLCHYTVITYYLTDHPVTLVISWLLRRNMLFWHFVNLKQKFPCNGMLGTSRFNPSRKFKTRNLLVIMEE